MSTIALIDFENATNTGEMDFSNVDELIVFKCANQLHKAVKLSEFKGDIDTINIDKIGKNNLGFHLVFKLGELHYQRSLSNQFYIISGDKGFDDVIHQLCEQGRVAKRVDPHAEKHKRACRRGCSSDYKRPHNKQCVKPLLLSKSDRECLDLLKRIPPNHLAKTLPKLANQLADGIANVDPIQIHRELRWLERNNLIIISGANQQVTYNIQ